MSRRKRAPKATSRCSSRATFVKPSTNPGSVPALVVVDDEVLAGQRQHPLEHHVVDRDRLDERLEVLGVGREAVDAAVQRVVEELAPNSGLRCSLVVASRSSRLPAFSTPTSE